MREETRYSFPLPCTFECSDKIITTGGTLQDISERGLCLLTPHLLSVGEEIVVQFAITNNSRFTAEGIIMWAKKTAETYSAGIHFNPSTIERSLPFVETVSELSQIEAEIRNKDEQSPSVEKTIKEWIFLTKE